MGLQVRTQQVESPPLVEGAEQAQAGPRYRLVRLLSLAFVRDLAGMAGNRSAPPGKPARLIPWLKGSQVGIVGPATRLAESRPLAKHPGLPF